MSAIQPFVWRHICVHIDEIIYNVFSDVNTFIKIPNSLQVQGAQPIEFTTMLIQGIQCGFLCDHVIITPPTQGTLMYAGAGWWYIPNPGAYQLDSFQYKLKYMGQESEVQTIYLAIDGYVPPPTYTITPDVTTINENGQIVTFDVSTTFVPENTRLYWGVIDGAAVGKIKYTDFVSPSGSFLISRKKGSFTVTTAADATTEGDEQFKVALHTGSVAGPKVAESVAITITDSSVGPPTTP